MNALTMEPIDNLYHAQDHQESHFQHQHFHVILPPGLMKLYLSFTIAITIAITLVAIIVTCQRFERNGGGDGKLNCWRSPNLYHSQNYFDDPQLILVTIPPPAVASFFSPA